ncbi:MAG: hypothetical protein KDA88_06255 [Planctomycetaceae bacterium]|nr:hypothetical protein [Planctomycetaceae bacterium]MCB9951443.1 hypothetical protein [Planctomycetaceae bacterium]
MLPPPHLILEQLDSGLLLPREHMTLLNHDDCLDRRDTDREFEKEWLRCREQIESGWWNLEPSLDSEFLVDAIREASFMTMSDATGHHEIASCVSDDFDLITRGSILLLNDDFLKSLWLTYTHHRIPPDR